MNDILDDFAPVKRLAGKTYQYNMSIQNVHSFNYSSQLHWKWNFHSKLYRWV